MKIQQFSQLGKRGNNEDSLGRNEVLLTVCDGMGGHNYGERASAFVVEHLLEAFAELQPLGKTEIQQHLSKVQADLNLLLEKEPELERMGTTFTGIVRTPDVWYAAHIGDSRIYLFRPAERKLWHTWDHSLVGELMRTHEITVEAGRFHPLSNRISKAIIAEKDKKPASASIVKIDELKTGDILLLCSDGVVEAWGDWDLVQLFADTILSFEQKCQKIAQQCNSLSKDNNTAIIAEIETADAFSFGSNDELEWTAFSEVEADYKHYLADCAKEEPELEADAEAAPAKKAPMTSAATPKKGIPSPQAPSPKSGSHKPAGKAPVKKKSKGVLWLLAILLLAVVGAVLFFTLGQNRTSDSDDDAPSSKNRKEQTDKEKSSAKSKDKNDTDKSREKDKEKNTVNLMDGKITGQDVDDNSGTPTGQNLGTSTGQTPGTPTRQTPGTPTGQTPTCLTGMPPTTRTAII